MSTDSALYAVCVSRKSAFNALPDTQNALKIKGMSVGSNIRRYRKAKGLTLDQVVDRFGSDTGNLSRIENDKQELTSGRLIELAAILEVHPSQLFMDPGTGVSENVEHYEVSQQRIEDVQLLDDYQALPVDLRDMVAKKAAEYRKYFEALPLAVRKNFSRPGDANRFAEWERDIEADIAGLAVTDRKAFLLEHRDHTLESLPPPVRKTVMQAQKELDKHQKKDGPRWVFVVVEDDPPST